MHISLHEKYVYIQYIGARPKQHLRDKHLDIQAPTLMISVQDILQYNQSFSARIFFPFTIHFLANTLFFHCRLLRATGITPRSTTTPVMLHWLGSCTTRPSSQSCCTPPRKRGAYRRLKRPKWRGVATPPGARGTRGTPPLQEYQ